MHCAVAVAAVAAAINNKKSLPKRHTEPFSDGFSSHLWSPIQCISTISFFLSFSIWIYSIHKMNANKSVKYKQTNKQIDLAVKYVICSFLNEMKWNEMSLSAWEWCKCSMKDEIANDGHLSFSGWFLSS